MENSNDTSWDRSTSIQTVRSKKPGTTEEVMEGPASMNEHATRINLHEHEDDEKGNGLCNVIASYAACAYRKGN